MYLALDGPSLQGTLSVTDAAVTEAKIGVSRMDERKVITVQPTNGKIYIYFGNSSVPSAATVIADGFVHFKNAIHTYEATRHQDVYFVAVMGTVTVKLSERG